MFVYRIAEELSRIAEITLYSPNSPRNSERSGTGDTVYFDDEAVMDPSNWVGKSGCFAPLRYFTRAPRLENGEVIRHLRDPRDLLTSLYVSAAFGHAREPGVFNPSDETRERWRREGIDRFLFGSSHDLGRFAGCTENRDASVAEIFLRKYESYCENLLGCPNVILVKYEQLVSDFPGWLAKVGTAFSLSADSINYRNIVARYQNEFVTDVEDPNRHKRQITPGDYQKKLCPESIDRLNQLFGTVMEKLGYSV